MSDFEVHPIGTATEIRLSRELARSIEQLMDQYGPGIVPESIRQAYERLYESYLRQIENGEV